MEITEKPNYVLKANEGIYYPKNPKLVPLKKAVWIIIALIIIGSLIFRENLFAELLIVGPNSINHTGTSGNCCRRGGKGSISI